MKIKNSRHKYGRFLKISAVSVIVFALAASLSLLNSHNVQADCSPATNNGTDTLTFSTPSSVTTTQNYYLWTRILVPTSTDTVQASVDGGTCYSIGGSSSVVANTWTWVNYANGQTGTPVQVSLTPGSHTLKYYGTAANTGIDKVLLLTSNNCGTPVGDGSNCEPVAPTISVTANPTTVTQGSTVTLSASVSDTSTISSVTFYDGTTKLGSSSSSSSPYTYSWQTSTSTAVGSHSITAQVADAANGTTASSPVTVKVSAPVATQPTPPNAPTGVTAKAASATSVNVSWTAATAPSGTVTSGYYVIRNGVNITPSGVTDTSYTDKSVVASTSYTYTVETFDSAGAVSVPSASAVVNTPAAVSKVLPTKPTITSATAVSSSQISLAWTTSTDPIGVAGYYVYLNGTKNTSTTATSYGITGLSPSTTYSIYVQAFDSAGNVSTASPKVSVKTKAATATSVTLSGLVTNAKTGTPIANVLVTTGRFATSSGTESTHTNSNGQYVLTNISPKATHTYRFSAVGYKSVTIQLKLSAGNQVRNVKLSQTRSK
ncbi:MAG: Ig-like domain-containing protein [Candidatus Saccharibacteria bacterium]